MYVCVMYMYMHSEKGVQSLTPPCIVHGTQATLANDQMIQLWKALDDNGNGRIDAGEFGRFMKRGQQAPPSTTPRQRAIAKRVATVAAAKAGEQRQALEEKSRFEGVRRATSEEAATISTLLNERIMMLFPHQEPTDVWYRLFKLADTSDKGRISYAELEVLVRSDTRGLNMSPSTLSTPLLKSLWLALIASQAPAPREEHQVKSSQVKSSQVKSSQVKSSQVKSSQVVESSQDASLSPREDKAAASKQGRRHGGGAMKGGHEGQGRHSESHAETTVAAAVQLDAGTFGRFMRSGCSASTGSSSVPAAVARPVRRSERLALEHEKAQRARVDAVEQETARRLETSSRRKQLAAQQAIEEAQRLEAELAALRI